MASLLVFVTDPGQGIGGGGVMREPLEDMALTLGPDDQITVDRWVKRAMFTVEFLEGADPRFVDYSGDSVTFGGGDVQARPDHGSILGPWNGSNPYWHVGGSGVMREPTPEELAGIATGLFGPALSEELPKC